MSSSDRKSSEHIVKTGRKSGILFRIVIALILLIVLLFFITPVLISSRSGRNMIVDKINSVIDGKIRIQKLSMGWFKGVELAGVRFDDESGKTSVTAGKVFARASYPAMLAGTVALKKAYIDEVEIKTSVAGSGGARRLKLRNINAELVLRPLGQKTTFDVAMQVVSANDISDVAAAGQIKTSGKSWSLEGASGQVAVEVNELNLASLAPLFAFLKVDVTAQGKLDADVKARLHDGQFEKLDVAITASNLDIAGAALRGDRIETSRLDVSAKLTTDEKLINIEKLKVKADWLSADVAGTIPKTFGSLADFLKADSSHALSGEFDCDLAATLAQVKNIANFKKDFDITVGRLSGSVDTASSGSAKTVSARMKLWTLEGKFPVKQIILSRPVELDIKIVSDKNDINVERFDLVSAFANVKGSGKFDAIDYVATFDLAKLQTDTSQFFDMENKFTGSARTTGKFGIVGDSLAISGKSVLSDFVVTTASGAVITEPRADIVFDLKADTKENLLYVNTLRAQAGPGSIMLRQTTLPLKGASPKPLSLNFVASADLKKLGPYMTAFTSFGDDMQMAGRMQTDFVLTKKGDIVGFVTRKTTIENLWLKYKDARPFVQSSAEFVFDGKFDLANRLYRIDKMQLKSPQINIEGKISKGIIAEDAEVKGRVSADYELSALSSLLSPVLPAGLKASGKRSDSLEFISRYPKAEPQQMTANLSAKTSFGFDSAEYMGLDFGKTELNVKVVNGVMTIAPFSTTVNQGRLNFAGNVDFTKPPALLRMPGAMNVLEKIQINARTTDALLKYINPIFADAVNVTGVLSFQSEELFIPLKGADKSAAVVVGTLSIDNMRLNASSLLRQIIELTGTGRNPVITILPTKFILRDSVLSYADMPMLIDGKTAVNFSGRIGLDKSMEMKLTLPFKYNGRRISVPLKGKVNRPEIDTEKLLQEQLQQELQRQIERGLKGLFE